MGENVATFHLDPGTVIAGRYEVCNKIGAGGMGMVFRALDRELNNDVVALKLLLPHLASEQTVFRRFLNEVLVARSLSHPNIVRLHDIGKAEAGFHYISMEYVDGYSLKDRLLDGAADEPTGTNFSPLTFDECIAILYRIASGVAYAHEKGVIHRDLKPANVLISKKGEVKLADFGTARIVGMDTSLTQTGQMIGTPDYMSPEQIRGESLDSACDIYSLGIIAYELVTGKRPFAADSAVAVAFKHLSEPLPEISGVTASKTPIPDWYPALVKKATSKDKKDRFPSGLEFVSALGERIPDSAKHTGFFSASRTGFFVSAPAKAPTDQKFELGSAPTTSSSGEWKLGVKAGEATVPVAAASPKRNAVWLVIVPLLLVGVGIFGYLQFEKSRSLNSATPPPRNKLEEELLSSLGGDKSPQPTHVSVTTVSTAAPMSSLTTSTVPETTVVPATVTTLETVPMTTVTETTAAPVTTTTLAMTVPVQHASAVDLAFQMGSQSVRSVEQFNVGNVTWSALVHGVAPGGENRDFVANLFSLRKKRVIGRLVPRSVSPIADQTFRLKGGLSDVAEDVEPGEYRFDLLYKGEFLLASKFTVTRSPEFETAPETSTTLPASPPVAPPTTLSSGLPPPVGGGTLTKTTDALPVITPDTIPPTPVTEQYGGSIDLIEAEGAQATARSLKLDLTFIGDDVTGSAEIEGVGAFSVKGNILARGMNLNLWSEKLGLRLTSGKPGGPLRGNYTVSNQRINGRWEAGKR